MSNVYAATAGIAAGFMMITLIFEPLILNKLIAIDNKIGEIVINKDHFNESCNKRV